MAVETFDLTIAVALLNHMPNVRLDGSSKPTLTAGGTILTEVAAEVNGALSAAGFTPSGITTDTPVSYNIVRKVVSLGAVGLVLQARQSSTQTNNYLDEYKRMLKAILTNPEMLSDVFSAASSSQVPRSHITDGSMTDRGTANTDVTPPWRAKDEW